MKVSEIIKILKDSYHPDTDLIVDWADREQFNGDGETTKEVWNKAVELVEDADAGSLDADCIQDFCYEAQQEVSNE